MIVYWLLNTSTGFRHVPQCTALAAIAMSKDTIALTILGLRSQPTDKLTCNALFGGIREVSRDPFFMLQARKLFLSRYFFVDI